MQETESRSDQAAYQSLLEEMKRARDNQQLLSFIYTFITFAPDVFDDETNHLLDRLEQGAVCSDGQLRIFAAKLLPFKQPKSSQLPM